MLFFSFVNRREAIQQLFGATLYISTNGLDVEQHDQQFGAPLPLLTKEQKIAIIEREYLLRVALGEKMPETIFDVFGMHDDPRHGGHPNRKRLIDDLRRWKAKSLHTLVPTQELAADCSVNNVELIPRILLDGNRFEEKPIKTVVGRVHPHFPSAVYKLFNEVNIPTHDNHNKFIYPDIHAKDWVTGAELVSELTRGQAKTALTAMAPNAYINGYSTLAYKREYLKEVVQLKGKSWLLQNTVDSIHPYMFYPEDDPLLPFEEEITEVLFDVLGTVLTIYGLEAGLQQESRIREFGHEIAAKAVVRILETKLKPYQRPFIKSYNFWLYHRGASDMPYDFTRCAWITDEGYNPEAREVEKFTSGTNA